MNDKPPTRQRRRVAISCTECRKHKKRCDRRSPCGFCRFRKTVGVCKYDEVPISMKPDLPIRNASGDRIRRSRNSTADESHSSGSRDSSAVASMGLLREVVSSIAEHNDDLSDRRRPFTQAEKLQSDVYFNYVRRIPSRALCDHLFAHYFAGPNNMHCAMEWPIFQEQLNEWWSIAQLILPGKPLSDFPGDMRCFPALLFQTLALAIQYLPLVHESCLIDLLYGSQDTADLSEEWTNCGAAIMSLLDADKPTLAHVQYSLLHDIWLCNTGDLLRSWQHSGQTIQLARSLELHIEPALEPTTHVAALLHDTWTNELKKRLWLNLSLWDIPMAMIFGRSAFMDADGTTTSPPLDCIIPLNRLEQIPKGRSEMDDPTPMSQRLLLNRLVSRIGDVKELEAEGSIPSDPRKVRELHTFVLDFRESLPPYFQPVADKRWDMAYPFLPVQREMLLYFTEAFMMAVHRPYVTTRQQSQSQIFESALSILDSQERLEEHLACENRMKFTTGITFPTFDAAMMLAAVLVLNPERYRNSFQRALDGLERALGRLKAYGPTMTLAKAGAEALESAFQRVIEAQGKSIASSDLAHRQSRGASGSQTLSGSSRYSPASQPWLFEPGKTIMAWNRQVLDFDFSNMQLPMPLKELALDDAIFPRDSPVNSSVQMTNIAGDGARVNALMDQSAFDTSENALWTFLTDDLTTSLA